MWKILGIFAKKVNIKHRIVTVHDIGANGGEDA
jgi:hypothetical protein